MGTISAQVVENNESAKTKLWQIFGKMALSSASQNDRTALTEAEGTCRVGDRKAGLVGIAYFAVTVISDVADLVVSAVLVATR